MKKKCIVSVAYESMLISWLMKIISLYVPYIIGLGNKTQFFINCIRGQRPGAIKFATIFPFSSILADGFAFYSLCKMEKKMSLVFHHHIYPPTSLCVRGLHLSSCRSELCTHYSVLTLGPEYLPLLAT